MEFDSRLITELLDVLIQLLFCFPLGAYVFKKSLRFIQEHSPVNSILLTLISFFCATVATVLAFLFLSILTISIRGRWCEGCMEYH